MIFFISMRRLYCAEYTMYLLFQLRIYRDIEKIKAGIAEQVCHFLNVILGFTVCITVSFIYGWQVTLLVISYIPIVCLLNYFIAKVNSDENVKQFYEIFDNNVSLLIHPKIVSSCYVNERAQYVLKGSEYRRRGAEWYSNCIGIWWRKD